MGFEKLEPIKGGYGGCLNCGYQYSILPLDAIIGVGFGYATVTKNNEIIYSETDKCNDRLWTCQDAENEAKKDPYNDWRIHLIAALSERHYQRQGDDEWVLYKRGTGFV